MNILAVDDEYFALELMRRALEEVAGNSNIFLGKDAREALSIAKERQIDVAFLDIHLPEMNGIELASELKKLNPKINVVFATGFSNKMQIVCEFAFADSADKFHKPWPAIVTVNRHNVVNTMWIGSERRKLKIYKILVITKQNVGWL